MNGVPFLAKLSVARPAALITSLAAGAMLTLSLGTAAQAEGYITEDQIAAGNTAYQAECASCHGQDMVASIARYPSAALFYTFISQAMPASAPGSLPPQQYADIVAYLLSENGWPVGSEVLPADTEVLSTIDPDQPPAAE